MKFRSIFKGDIYVWAIVFTLSIIGVLAVYSATGTLAFAKQSGNTEFYLLRHLGFLVVGLFLMYLIHNIPVKYYARPSQGLLWLSFILLIATLVVGYRINNAARVIPILGFTFQPSDMAKVFLVMFMAKYLSKRQDSVHKSSVMWWLLGVIALIIAPIIPENLSTALVIITTSTMIMLLGRIKFKYIISLIGVVVVLAGLFYVTLMNLDMSEHQNSRLPTWKKRIETYIGKSDDDSDYQQTQAKIAVASGGFWGKGPGNSTQRNFLPHPYSDFIFAIIVEEYGMIGALLMISAFILLIIRALKMAIDSQRPFAALAVLGLAVSISFQAFIHMGVSVGKLPVTGLTLPLVSMGGTSIIFNSIAFGIILGISRHIQEEKLLKSTSGPGATSKENNDLEEKSSNG